MFYDKYYDNNGYFNIFQGYFVSRLSEKDYTIWRNICNIYPTKF